MFSIEEFITAVLCCVDDASAKLTQEQTIRAKGLAALSDSEVLTIEIVADNRKLLTHTVCRWLNRLEQLVAA